MATSVSNLTKYYIDSAFAAFKDMLAPVSAFALATNPNGAQLNDIVRVPFVNTNTASVAFAYSTGYATSGHTVIGKNVTLGTLSYQLIDLTDGDFQSPDTLTRLGSGAGAQLASDVLAAVWLNVTQSNYSNRSTVSSSLYDTWSNVVALQTSANTSKWPQSGRSLIMGPTLYGNVLSNTTLIASSYGNPRPVQEGQLNSIVGFTPYAVTNLPVNNEILQGFICNQNALLLANAYHVPSDGNNYNTVQRISDPETGLVMGYREWYDPKLCKMQRAFDVLYGTAIGDANALYRITTRATV